MARKQAAHSDSRTPVGTSALQSQPASVMTPRLALLLSAAVLLVIGLVMVFSTTSITGFAEQGDALSETIKQVVFAVVGIAACVLVARFISMDLLRTHLAEILWGISFALLIATAIMGTVGLGAKRWLFIGSFGIQPSEFAKITITIMAAKLAAEYTEGLQSASWTLGLAGIYIVVPLLIMVGLQSDLGTTMICVVSVLAVMLLCGVPIRALLVVLLGIGILGIAAIALSSYRSSRLNFMDPWADPANTGYQLVHSFLALASGGIFGVGLGNSFEKMLYLPEAETDFIFAIIGEEGGLIATLFVVLCFCVFLYGGFRIALNSHDKMGVYLAGALTTMLVFQAFLNIMCAIGLAPTTGKPLPFISSGGSSLISSLIVVGLILSVSYNNSSNSPARRRDELRILTAEPPAPARAYRSQQRSTSRGSSGGSNAYGGFKPASNARGYEEDAYVNRNRGYSDGYSDGRSPRNTRSSRAGRGGSSRNSRR